MLLRALLFVLITAAPVTAQAAPEIGQPAPDFTLTDTYGQGHSLDAHRGSWVVLEWFNFNCPYTQKHYRTGNIPSQQAKWTGRDVVWLSVITTPPGAAPEPAELGALADRHGNQATAVVLDSDGTVGRAFGARTTPHLVVIDPTGELAYMGAIDDVPTARDEDLARATQLVDRALEQATAGQPVTVPVSRPYGCAITYK